MDPRPSRILVIDDEEPIVELLEDILDSAGHSVVTALSGRDGLAAFESERFDLVFTDIGMPDVSGWDVCARMRESRPEIPVVLVTGWGSSVSDEEVAASGAAAVIGKPFEIEEVLEGAARLLPGQP